MCCGAMYSTRSWTSRDTFAKNGWRKGRSRSSEAATPSSDFLKWKNLFRLVGPPQVCTLNPPLLVMFIRDITFSHKRKPTRVLHDKNLEHDFQFNYAFCFVNIKYTPWKSCPATYAYTMYYYKDYNQATMLEIIFLYETIDQLTIPSSSCPVSEF